MRRSVQIRRGARAYAPDPQETRSALARRAHTRPTHNFCSRCRLRAHARACVHACTCVRAPAHVRECACARACTPRAEMTARTIYMRAQPARTGGRSPSPTARLAARSASPPWIPLRHAEVSAFLATGVDVNSHECRDLHGKLKPAHALARTHTHAHARAHACGRRDIDRSDAAPSVRARWARSVGRIALGARRAYRGPL